MADITLPNIVGQYQQGLQFGQQQRANKLAGLAYNSQGTDRQSALGQLAGVNPQLAVGLGNAFQQQDAAQAAVQKTAEVDHAKKLNGLATAILKAKASGNPAMLQGTWRAGRQYLAELTGKDISEIPENFDPAMLPLVYQAAAQSGGMPDQKGTVVAPGGVLVNSATGEQMFANPANPAKGQLVDVPDGRGGSVKMLFDPSTGQLSPPGFSQSGQGGYSTATLPPDASGAGAPAVTPASPFNTQAAAEANAMLAQHMDPTAIMQHLAAKYPTQRFDIALDPSTGQFKDVSNGSARMPQGGGLGYDPGKRAVTLTPEELRAAGLPEGTVAQRDATGKISVVSKPPQLSPDKLADIAAKRQKAQQAQQDSVATFNDSIGKIDSLLKSPSFGVLGTFIGDASARIPHTDAADAKAQLDTIGNQSVLNTLSALKSLSATGASGFGALSEKEGEILRNAAANLSTGQSNAALRQNLLDLRKKLERARDRVAQQRITLPEDSVGQPQQSQPQSGGVDDLLSKYGAQ